MTVPVLLPPRDVAAARQAVGPNAPLLLFAETEEVFRVRVEGTRMHTFLAKRAGTSMEYWAGGHRIHAACSGVGRQVLRRLIQQGDGGPPHEVPGEADDAPDLLDEGLRQSLCEAVADAAEVIGSSAAIPHLTGEIVRHVVAADDGHVRGRGDDDRHRVKLLLGAHEEGGPPHARALRVVAGSSGASLLASGEHRTAAAEVAEAAIARGHAVPAPAGEMPVVLGPGSPASLFHEVCGHGLEGDIANSPGAAYGPLIGKMVAGPALTIVDDPRMPERAPLYARDDEGEAARETVLVDHGVVASVLADRTTARLLRRPATGNGRRIGYQYPALTRMSCTYIKPGDVPPAAALDGIRRGLYVAAIVSGETNMSGESFEARTTEAYLIENGALTRPVTDAVLTGRGLDLLRAVDVVCDDLRFLSYGFVCNKLGQFPLAVSVGQPTLRIRQLAVHA